MSSLDRLIELAKKTGDRLIVHDPIEGRDVVIMDIDEYENMVIDRESIDRDIRGMSSRQMLDQINRDIAIWRTNKEMEEQWEKEEMLENEMEEEGPFDPFGETDFHMPEWHSAGSVLEERFHKNIKAEKHENTPFDFEDEDVGDDNILDIPDFSNLGKINFDNKDEDEIKVEDIPVADFGENIIRPVPKVRSDFNGSGSLKEEKLPEDDEPVFYEEPV